MIQFLYRRAISIVIVLLALVVATFVLQRLSPTDPVTAMLGHGASARTIRYWTGKLGYNRSIWDQLIRYLGHVLHGNLGYSLQTRQPVASAIWRYLPPTLELTIAAFALAALGGVAMAVLSVRLPKAGHVLRWLMLAAASAPVFLVAVLAMLLFYQHLGWLPASGQTSVPNAPTGPTGMLLIDSLVHGQLGTFGNAVSHIILPACCLALVPATAIGRVLSAGLSTTAGASHMRTARMNGLGEWAVIFRHGLRNSANGALSMAGLQVGAIFVGIVVVEQAFAWPGLGSYAGQAMADDNFPVVLGITIVIGALYVIVSAVVDLLQVLADPRIALA